MRGPALSSPNVGTTSELLSSFALTKFTNASHMVQFVSQNLVTSEELSKWLSLLDKDDLKNCLRCSRSEVAQVIRKYSADVGCGGCVRALKSLTASAGLPQQGLAFALFEENSEEQISMREPIQKLNLEVLVSLFSTLNPSHEEYFRRRGRRQSQRCPTHSALALKSVNWVLVWESLPNNFKEQAACFEVEQVRDAFYAQVSGHVFCTDCRRNMLRAMRFLFRTLDPQDDLSEGEEYCESIYHPFSLTTELCECDVCEESAREREDTMSKSQVLGQLDVDNVNESNLNDPPLYEIVPTHIKCSLDSVKNMIQNAQQREKEETENGGVRERHASTLKQAQQEVVDFLCKLLLQNLRSTWMSRLENAKVDEHFTWVVLQCMRTKIQTLVTDYKRAAVDHWLDDLEKENTKFSVANSTVTCTVTSKKMTKKKKKRETKKSRRKTKNANLNQRSRRPPVACESQCNFASLPQSDPSESSCDLSCNPSCATDSEAVEEGGIHKSTTISSSTSTESSVSDKNKTSQCPTTCTDFGWSQGSEDRFLATLSICSTKTGSVGSDLSSRVVDCQRTELDIAGGASSLVLGWPTNVNNDSDSDSEDIFSEEIEVAREELQTLMKKFGTCDEIRARHRENFQRYCLSTCRADCQCCIVGWKLPLSSKSTRLQVEESKEDNRYLG